MTDFGSMDREQTCAQLEEILPGDWRWSPGHEKYLSARGAQVSAWSGDPITWKATLAGMVSSHWTHPAGALDEAVILLRDAIVKRARDAGIVAHVLEALQEGR